MGKVQLECHMTARLSYLMLAVFAGASACCGVKLRAGQRAASCCNSATSSSLFSSSSFRSSLTMSSSSIHDAHRHCTNTPWSVSAARITSTKVHSVHSKNSGKILRFSNRGRQHFNFNCAEVSTATLDLIHPDVRGKFFLN